MVPVLKQKFNKFSFIELINGRGQTNWDQKSNLLLLQRHNQSYKKIKNWQKVIQKHWYLLHWIHYNQKIDGCENIHSVNSFYLQVSHASGYIEEKNGNKYLVFDDSVNENKESLKKYADVWDGIKNEIRTINGGKENGYEKDYMKIKFNSDDDLPLKKPLKFHAMTIIIRSVFEEAGKPYTQPFLDDTLYELV